LLNYCEKGERTKYQINLANLLERGEKGWRPERVRLWGKKRSIDTFFCYEEKRGKKKKEKQNTILTLLPKKTERKEN